MEYKLLLRQLAVFGAGAIFDTKGVSKMLISAEFFPAKPPHYSLLPPLYSPKRISGDLDRLYRMGFLNRKRRLRLVSQRASTCFRGFKYDYRISKQGWQYLKYLEKGIEDPLSAAVDERIRIHNTDSMYERLPEPLAEDVERIISAPYYNDTGRHHRFPRMKRDELLYSLQQCRDKLRRKQAEIDRLKETIFRAGYQHKKQ